MEITSKMITSWVDNITVRAELACNSWVTLHKTEPNGNR